MPADTVTTKEAAERLGVSHTKVWRLVKDGVLPAIQNPLDRREKRIPEAAIQLPMHGASRSRAEAAMISPIVAQRRTERKKALAAARLLPQ